WYLHMRQLVLNKVLDVVRGAKQRSAVQVGHYRLLGECPWYTTYPYPETRQRPCILVRGVFCVPLYRLHGGVRYCCVDVHLRPHVLLVIQVYGFRSNWVTQQRGEVLNPGACSIHVNRDACTVRGGVATSV